MQLEKIKMQANKKYICIGGGLKNSNTPQTPTICYIYI